MRRFALGVMFSVFAALAQERDTALADLRKSIEAGETRGIDENIKQICRGPSDLHGCESWTAKVSDWLQEQGGTERYQAAIGMLVTVRDLRHRLRGANSENPEILIGLTEQRLHLGDQVPLQALVERAVALLKADKPESVMLARALDDLASVFDAKDPRRALSLRQEVVRMRRKVFPAGSVEIAEALNNLGDAYTSLDDYPRGIAAYLEGQVIAHAADPNGYVEAVIANNLGDAYHHTSDFPDAERYYKLATDLIEKQRGPDSPSLADALDNLASLYNQTDRFAEVERLRLRALEIRRKSLPPDHPSLALGISNLGTMYYRRDAFARAEELYRESLAIREKTLGPENPQTGESLDNLGQALVAQGRYGAAEPYYQRALALFKKAPGSTARLARTLNNLGMLYYDQGDYTRAEPFLERSLALTRRPTRPDQAELERVEGNLESLYADEGDFTKAEPMARRILATREKIYRTPHHEVAYGAAQLASIYRAHKDYKLATTYDAQALATMEKVYLGGHTDIAVFLSHLALDNTLTGDFAAAEPLFARAIEIQRALPSDHPQRIATLANFALMNYKKGNYGRARELYSAALEISEKAHNPGHPDTIALMIDGARTLWQLDQHAESRDLLASANRSVVEFWARNLLRSEDSRRGTLITKFDELLPVTLAIAAASRREDPIGATTLAALAIGARKGVQSAARQEIYATIRHETNPQALELFGKLVETAEQEGRLLHSTAPDAATKLAALRASENEAERRLLDGSGRYRDWLKPVEPSDVAANLAPGTAFIDVLRYRQVDIVTGAPGAMRYAAAIYRNGTPPRLVDLGPASLIDAAVRTLRLNFENIWEVSGGVRKLISGDRFQANLAQTEADCAVLFRRVMTKLLPALESAKDLIIAPDAALAEIPWEIMRDDRGYLIEHGYRVRYIDSARSLVYPAPERDPHSQAAVIAEVDYNGGSAGSVENASMVAFPWATEERPAGGWMAWQPLNGGAEILKTLRELQNSGKIAVIRKLPRGSEEEIAALDRPAAIIAHTHGFFQAARRIGDLPDSGIVLYGANRADRPAVRDGWLTSKEVMLLNLEGTRLVALLGCDTGRGVEAGEGVQGLRHALQVAGARSTMLTLWQVGDLSAARFLREWLIRSSGHSGNSMEAALADTRLAFLHGDAREPNAARQSNRWRHPYFWAAATLAGTGGALNMAVDAH